MVKLINQLSRREKTLFFLTLSAVGLSLIFKFVIDPLIKRSEKLTQELKAKQIQLRRAESLSKQEGVQKQYEAFISAIKSSAKSEAEMSRLLSEIEKLAKDAGVNIVNILPQEVEDKKFYKKFSAELKIEGTNQQILKYIFSLESSPLLLRIDKLNLSSRASRQGLLNSSLTLYRIVIP
jgi:Tfp pilus assembly protein PilO